VHSSFLDLDMIPYRPERDHRDIGPAPCRVPEANVGKWARGGIGRALGWCVRTDGGDGSPRGRRVLGQTCPGV